LVIRHLFRPRRITWIQTHPRSFQAGIIDDLVAAAEQGVPVGQIFYPPYLFTAGGGMAARPRIVSAPAEISYRGHFDLRVAGSSAGIGSVAILRSDHNTHSLTTGDRYVKLAFHPKGDPRKGEIRVVAPKLPSQAVPGVKAVLHVGGRVRRPLTLSLDDLQTPRCAGHDTGAARRSVAVQR
jgi:hypothetical protein